MLDPKPFSSGASRPALSPSGDSSQEPKQRRLMLIALSLLLVALVVVLYHDRDFWFPDADQAENPPQETVAPSSAAVAEAAKPATLPRKASLKPRLSASAERASSVPPVTAIASRTVLPPLEVEVIAGDTHRTVRPPSNEVSVDLDSSTPPSNPDAFAEPDTAANLTSNAAEHVQMSDDTSEVVSHSVEPGYPLLARQMKVQGSVILLAMISRDGTVQDLRILSGPPILGTAAREAVRQWHFKPHYENSVPVETLARVTVNFTISTN
jgi:TonB family protein